MPFICKPDCNFLHGYFRCLLPTETVDIEVKIKMMRGIHTFRRDWTTQVISCNPCSTGLHPNPSQIRKRKTYIELEGKLGAQLQLQLHTITSSPDKNSLPQKTLVPKKAEKKKRPKAPVKRRFKVRVIAQPMLASPSLSMNPTLSTDPTPTVVTTMVMTQMPVEKPATTTTKSIPVNVYNLAQGKFKGISYLVRKVPGGRRLLHSSSNNPLVKQQPEAAITATFPQKQRVQSMAKYHASLL